MPERQKKKVLILTLGTGRKLPNGAPAGYVKTSYQYGGDGETVESAYVAEPLVREFRPDMIFVIGTVKSAWLEFYQYFTSGDTEEEELAFCELDPVSGRDVAGEELRKDTEAINGIFARGLDREPFSRAVPTRVILTRYGMNNEELLENYQLLSSVHEWLEPDIDYEIAFDITHSFRSLPIYHLVILNYLSVISSTSLNISHIYYGNLDVRRENGDIAPILDLHDLMDVMHLTSGVSEFKNTGNSRTLLEQIPETESTLRDALERFDWATQTNSFDKVQKSLEELLRMTERETTDNSRYTDLNHMINEVLCRKFLGRESGGGNASGWLEEMSIADRRLMTARWYLNQNRYGQAVATAYEALKSYLVPLYLTKVLKKPDAAREDCLKETYLRSAVMRLDSVYAYCLKKKQEGELSGMEKFFMELGKARRRAVPVRNRFAHNLMEEGDGRSVKMTPKQEKSSILRLVDLTGRLKAEIENHPDEVAKVYARRTGSVRRSTDAADQAAENIVVITELSWGVPYRDYRKSLKREYHVYAFEGKVIKAIRENKNKIENAVLLRKILQGQELDYEHTQIYFYGMDDMDGMAAAVQYAMVLQEEPFKAIKMVREDGTLKAIRHMDIRLDRDYYEGYELGESMEELQYTDMIEMGEKTDG